MNFSGQLLRETPANAGFCNWLSLENVSTKIYFSKNISFDFSHLCFDIQWHVFPGIKCVFVFSGPRLFCLASTHGPGPQFVFAGPGPQFVFTVPGPQFVFNSPDLEYVFTGPSSKFVFRGPGPKFVFTGPGL